MSATAFAVDDQWRIARPDALEWRSWDDEIVLYDERSDETHHFDVATACIFETLTTHPSSMSDLAEVLAERLHVVADAELAGLAGEIVRMLYAKNIIAPATPGRDAGDVD